MNLKTVKKRIKGFIPEPIKSTLRPVTKLRKRVQRKLKVEYYIANAKLRPSKAVYYCPCCNHKLTKFVDGKYIERNEYFNPIRYANTEQKVQCPVCRTIPRHRILALYFQKHINELKNKRILYFAEEFGIQLWMKRHEIHPTTADLYVPANLKLNIEDTQLPDNSWDWIICNHVLEHVNDYQKALRELYRILSPNGTLIISFPILSALPTLIEEGQEGREVPENETEEERRSRRLQNFGQADHLRIFGADSAKILSSTGFKVSVINGEKMPKEILPITGPADYDVNYLFVCKKPEQQNL